MTIKEVVRNMFRFQKRRKKQSANEKPPPTKEFSLERPGYRIVQLIDMEE